MKVFQWVQQQQTAQVGPGKPGANLSLASVDGQRGEVPLLQLLGVAGQEWLLHLVGGLAVVSLLDVADKVAGRQLVVVEGGSRPA
ncbi:MAG: hypothetical protein HC888_04395 [Candidatus Competibacteraceae bacterium]|nr:hypothetical protein [Candidatus Competibacteraceae bacterium]